MPRRHTVEPYGGSGRTDPDYLAEGWIAFTTTSRQGLRSIYEDDESFNGPRLLVIAVSKLTTSGLLKR